jgi:hypothetical protein
MPTNLPHDKVADAADTMQQLEALFFSTLGDGGGESGGGSTEVAVKEPKSGHQEGMSYASCCYLPNTFIPLPLLGKRTVNHDTQIFEFGLPEGQSLNLPVCSCLLLTVLTHCTHTLCSYRCVLACCCVPPIASMKRTVVATPSDRTRRCRIRAW